ncbi:uncharacterized protein LOC110031946 [Phalaenopsis equestris]|uniref:uncharacterized protein LOC110031946 n=1 Tax=Phalaenopsis equestris TaxID=78828 RepID=UPI0009E3BA79|nr:uncharacterized protein LOC110031946 [Phalaenopsis equestris]
MTGDPLSDNLRTIFVDSNIDTHLALVVSPYDTIAAIKAKISAEHAFCFQDIGEISIQSIKVSRRGFLYNLADSMYVLNAFEGVQRSWFVRIDAVPRCTVKDQKELPNKVTDENLKHHDYAVPACNVDKHQEVVFCGLSSKNSGSDGQENHTPNTDREFRPTMLTDQDKDDKREDNCSNLGKESCTHKTISSKRSKSSQQDKLIESQSEHYLVKKKRGKKLKLHEELLEDIKFRGSEDINESNKSSMIPQEINCDGEKGVLAISSEGLPSKLPHENIKSLQLPPVKKHSKKRKSKSSKSYEEIGEEHLEDCRRGSKFSGSEDINESNKSAIVFQEISCDGEKEILAISSEGLLSKLSHDNIKSLQDPPVKKHSKRRKCKSYEVAQVDMSFDTAAVRSPQVTVNPQDSGKEANASIFSGKCSTGPNSREPLANDQRVMSATHDIASFLKVPNQKETRHSMEVNKVPIEEQIIQVNPEDQREEHASSKHTNVVASLKESAGAKVISQVVSKFPTKLYCNAEGLPSKLPHENIVSFQNPLVEKHAKKRKRKSSKPHEEAHLVMPNVVRSDSGKETNASIFSGKHSAEQSIEESLANDEKDIWACTSLLKVANTKESIHSMEINKEPIEERSTQVNPEGQSEKHVSSDQDANVDVSLKEPAEVRVSSQAASESPTKLNCSIDKLKSQSSKILEPKEAYYQESRSSDATKCIRDLHLGETAASAEGFPYQEQATNGVSNLKGANEACFLAKVDSKERSKSWRSRKKSKAGSSGVFESTQLDGNKDEFNFDNAQMSLNEFQNESNAGKHIKRADQKANGGLIVDAMIKMSSPSKKVPKQDEVSNMNSGNPPICMPNNLNEVSKAFDEQAAEIRVPSQASSEAQAKPARSRKKSKSEPSKLGSEENCAVLSKFNGEATESNEERAFEPSKYASECNQKTELHCMDAMVLQDDNERYRIIIEGHVTQYEALAGPTKSKCDRKKSKKETLKAHVSSEMIEPTGCCRPDEFSIKFDDYFVSKEGKHSPAVHAAVPSSGKTESRKKKKSRKNDINQPYQDSPNLTQPSSHKQHTAISQPLENGTRNDTGNVIHDAGTKDSETGIIDEAKSTKQSTKQNSSLGRIESDSSLHKAHDNHKLEKKLQNYEPESHVQLSKSGAMGNKEGKKITPEGKGKTQSLAPDHHIDNVDSKDGIHCKEHNPSAISNSNGDAVGSNIFYVSESEAVATELTSSDSTEDKPYQKKRYRVVRKIPSRISKKITNNSNVEKSRLVSSGRIFSDASVTSSESENDPYKKKAAIKTTLDDSSISGDSESPLEETQTKASALKLWKDTNSFGAESDEGVEISQEADGRTELYNRSDATTQKMPLSSILKSSISFRKSKLTASQSEFPDAENQPIDGVLGTT